MQRFDVFHSKDPPPASSLHKNGYQRRRTVSFEEKYRESNWANSYMDSGIQNTSHVFNKFTRSKVPTSPIHKTSPVEYEFLNLKEIKDGHRVGFATNEILAVGSPLTVKPMTNFSHERQTSQAAYIGHQRGRSYSAIPPSNGFLDDRPDQVLPRMVRRHTTMSLFYERPFNAPVLIRNNNVRLRKYSCPEYYTTSTNENKGRQGGRETATKGFSTKPSTNTSSSRQLVETKSVKELHAHNASTNERTEALRNRSPIVCPDIILPTGSEMKKEPNRVVQDFNPQELNHLVPIIQQEPSVTDNSDNGLSTFHFCEDEESLQSYSLEANPKHALKESAITSSMYGTRSHMLNWLGEVNKNSPQFLG